MAKPKHRIEFVIGVDTHKHTHTASVVNAQGAELHTQTMPVTREGFRRLLQLVEELAPQARLWAVEGSGSYGRGLTSYLLEHNERVVEVDRPKRRGRRNAAKSDALDATLAAREILARRNLTQPRRRGRREALRVLHRTRQGAIHSRSQALCHLQALVVTADESLRARLAPLRSPQLVTRCARLRHHPSHSTEHRATVIALRATARRIVALGAEADAIKSEIRALVQTLAPPLLHETGVGVITAAEILCAWSHPGRLRSEAAFAALAGVAPIPASSGQTVRHRLNRRGDRRLNCALHTIVLSRLQFDETTKRYELRRLQEGKTRREIRRCLKRYVARHIFRLLENMTTNT